MRLWAIGTVLTIVMLGIIGCGQEDVSKSVDDAITARFGTEKQMNELIDAAITARLGELRGPAGEPGPPGEPGIPGIQEDPGIPGSR